MYFIQMPQMHCKIINLTKIFCQVLLRYTTWIRIFIKGWNSINIHQSNSNELLKWSYGICSKFCNNIQIYIYFYDFISIFFVGIQYMIQNGKKNWIEKHYNKSFNQQIIMDFWMTKFRPYFQKSLSCSFFVGLIFFPL